MNPEFFIRFISFLILLALTNNLQASTQQLVRSASAQVGVTVHYDPAYTALSYPNGDVPIDRGVCSDVVIRALRGVGIDLQKVVHEDMRANFASYPNRWGLKRPDKNIDHRRVPNLERFFERRGKALAKGTEFLAGDIVSWRLDNGLPHIGIVSDKKAANQRPLIIHNIGSGAKIEDVLNAWQKVGHYRWFSTVE